MKMIQVQKDNFRQWLPYLSTLTFTFLALALVTGFLLSARFVPSTEAYTSTKAITDEASFGWLIRGVHWWASSLALIMSLLFTTLAYWFGAYGIKTRWLWWSGLLVGLMLLGGNVTGYYLPLDQNAYWRLIIEAQLFHQVPVLGPAIQNFLLGGESFSSATIARLNWLHTLVLPVLTVIAMASHLYAAKQSKTL
ncbi:cytochrome b N-terminal domain-containing protein [Anthocerotibacter panamensis]|uniref:cytochrome b N-terminal domain-containing protein n=1 Tax=Anthocerotibacter panamensis TaxID=2857077 RepID=UPI001C40401F|nr:cytochrome b N-terminal domain-containing protein [Anthocerotibacter panamensis]